VNIPDPVKLGLTVHVYNYDAVTLYMKIDGYNGAWAFGTVNEGSMTAGTDRYFNLDQFGSRARPAAATIETITVRLRAYTDAGYTILKWTYLRTIDIVFIKSDDGTWTEDFLNNFDDGTVQGWAVAAVDNCKAGYPTIAVAADYVLSVPWSLKTTNQQNTQLQTFEYQIYKQFTTPNRPIVYAIIDIRQNNVTNGPRCCIRVILDADTILQLGRLGASASNILPTARWLRIVVPLTPNVTKTLRIYVQDYAAGSVTTSVWMDDFRIISK
jgi:hypothetical protein